MIELVSEYGFIAWISIAALIFVIASIVKFKNIHDPADTDTAPVIVLLSIFWPMVGIAGVAALIVWGGTHLAKLIAAFITRIARN